MKYHILKPGVTLKAYCGRRIGTPGGKIYGGVQAMRLSWFRNHPHPKIVDPKTCKTCARNTIAHKLNALLDEIV
jgi:hypothetical protein